MRICLLVLLFGLVFAQEQNSTHEHHPAIYILGPQEVRSAMPSINYTAADFGFIPYGHRIFGQVVLADPLDACSPLNLTQLPDLKAPHMNTVVIATRGVCPFVRKAFHAQLVGAHMLIVVDMVDQENVDFVIMVSDHTLQVQIPTIMVSKSDGLELIKYVQMANQPITLMTKFHVQPDLLINQMIRSDQVNLQYHLSSLDLPSYHFLTQFGPFYTELASQITFIPHYVIFECGLCRSYGWQVNNEGCICGGRYCGPDPDGAGPITGREVVLEDLRQICLFRNDPMKWWQYMFNFRLYCMGGTNITECNQKVLQIVKADISEVEKCFNQSFVNTTNPYSGENSILQGIRDGQETHPIYIWPSLYINGMFYKGDLYFENQTTLSEGYYNVSNYAVLEAICAGFTKEFAPKMCDNTVALHITPSGMIEKENPRSSDEFWLWLGVISSLILVMALSFFLYRRLLRREMHAELQNQVEHVLSNYYKMDKSAGRSGEEV